MYRTVLWTLGEGEGGMIWENGIETCILSYVKQIASLGSMHETGCSGLVNWDNPEGTQEMREELQGRATIPRVPQMCQSIPEEPVFPALP